MIGHSLWILANFGVCLLGIMSNHSGEPVVGTDSYSLGIKHLTLGRFIPGAPLQFLVLVSILFSIRWLVLEYRIYFGRGPIEVRPLDDATGRSDIEAHNLDIVFLDYLASPRLYPVTTVPGDPEPDHLNDILKAPAYSGWRGLLVAAISYAIPRRCFIVSATLRTRDEHMGCGVSIQIRRLPGSATELETQWSSSFERALQRAAYAVAAHILPQTYHCRNVPWSDWRGRVIPMSLFRDYQRAKRMVQERRYDEAMALYHRALMQDSNNVGLLYDVGQLYELLKLYPDALHTYLRLVNRIFPPREAATGKDPDREAKPRWWPDRVKDPWVIRYRYVILLGLGTALARELWAPDWPNLTDWLGHSGDGGELGRQHEERPWRVAELANLRRQLSLELDELFPTLASKTVHGPGTLVSRLPKKDPVESGREALLLERYLLLCAHREADSLIKDFEKLRPKRIVSRVWHRRESALTLTAVRHTRLTIEYRQQRLEACLRHVHTGPCRQWAKPIAEIEKDLADVGYCAETSSDWLEHYNVACLYALALMDDESELAEHEAYARAAVAALERALGSGSDVDFIRSKRYWLQAGDPDLTGLRRYGCFRAFEARVYGRPFPATVDVAKCELYLHLRSVLETGAKNLEREWRKRADAGVEGLTLSRFEQWWRREEHALQLGIRLGRFYRQWQTRRAVLQGLRDWIEAFGSEAHPVPYPDLIRADYLPDLDDFHVASDALLRTEAIFNFLGFSCGNLRGPGDLGRSTLAGKTHDWAEYANALSRDAADPLEEPELVAVCRARAALWAALRQWAHAPSRERQASFESVIASLQRAPRPKRALPGDAGPPLPRAAGE
jgi:hypothetical protein